jgi:hypothetical protein
VTITGITVVYPVVDGAVITLPTTPTNGQTLILSDYSCSSGNSGFTLNVSPGQTMSIVNTLAFGSGFTGLTTEQVFCNIQIIYSGGIWYSFGYGI